MIEMLIIHSLVSKLERLGTRLQAVCQWVRRKAGDEATSLRS